MISEGGTWDNHAITTFTANKVTGPYTPTQVNPVLTHRHFGNNFPITTVGHADLVKTQNGEWWSVMLGCRPIDGKYYLGRETFLTPVTFQGTTPIFSKGNGQVLLEDKRPNLPWHPFKKEAKDDFQDVKLGLDWNFIRTPQTKWYSLKNGSLEIQTRPEKITDRNNPSVIARRLEFLKSKATTKFNFKTKKQNEVAGLVTFQNENYQYQLLKTRDSIKLLKVYNKDRKQQTITLIESVLYKHDNVVMQMRNENMTLKFFYGKHKNDLKKIGDKQDASVITSKVAGGFIGAYVGMYSSSQGKPSKNLARFDWFEYINLKE